MESLLVSHSDSKPSAWVAVWVRASVAGLGGTALSSNPRRGVTALAKAGLYSSFSAQRSL